MRGMLGTSWILHPVWRGGRRLGGRLSIAGITSLHRCVSCIIPCRISSKGLLGSSSMAEALRDPILLLGLAGGFLRLHPFGRRLTGVGFSSGATTFHQSSGALGAFPSDTANFSAWRSWAASMGCLVVPPSPGFLSAGGRSVWFGRWCRRGEPLYAGAVHGKLLGRILCRRLPRFQPLVKDAVLCLVAPLTLIVNGVLCAKEREPASSWASILRRLGDNSGEPWEGWKSSGPFPCCAGQWDVIL